MGSGIGKFLKYLTPQMMFFRLRRFSLLRHYKGRDLRLALGAKIRNSTVGYRVFIGQNSALINSSIGDNSYISGNSELRNVSIGKFCSIGPGVKIGLGAHPLNMVSTHPAFYANDKEFMTFANQMYFNEFKQVLIGNDVWIGEDVMIPGGVKIGDGAAIAARAVVTKDVEPYAFVGGVPAGIIQYRFPADMRAKMLEIKWWDSDIEWLKTNYRLFQDAEKFIKFCETTGIKLKKI